MSTNTQRAVLRVKNRMRDGCVLLKSNTVHGPKWYVVPTRRTKLGGREVADDIAELVIREVDVFPRRDGMWPGCDQTYGIGDQ